jgi:hypothetical protein
MVTAGIHPFRENSHGRAGDRTQDLIISGQRLRPLDHEAGQSNIILHIYEIVMEIYTFSLPEALSVKLPIFPFITRTSDITTGLFISHP